MSYLVLLKFNSRANAQLFLSNPYNSAVLQATEATVPTGYIGPSGPSTGIGQPSSAPSSTYTYVDIYVPSINAIPTGYYTPTGPSATQLIFNNDTRQTVYLSPNFDPNTITIMEGQNTIIKDGLPGADWSPDPTLDSPIEFKPIYYPGEDLNDIYKQYLKLVADYPQDPNVMRPDSEYHDPFNPLDPANQALPEIFPRPEKTPEDVTIDPSYDPMAPYDDTQFPTPPPYEFNLEPVPSPPTTTTPFDDSPVEVPGIRPWEVPVDPMPFFVIPQPPVIKTSVEGPQGGGAPPSIWGCVAGGGPLIVLLDDSCTVYTSSDGGNTFCNAGTPAATIADDWSDMAIPVNDAASPVPNVMALWDFTVAAAYDPTQFDGSRGGVQVISPRLGSPATALIRNYSPGTVGVNFQQCYSGAISSNGTILNCPMAADSLTFPRISTDFGNSWSNVTGLPSGNKWSRACFSKNASTMYIARFQSFTYKSTNSGSTWTQLNASGAPSTWGGNGENKARLLCSSDGTIFAGIDLESAIFYLTKNGGTTWSSVNLFSQFSLNGRSSIDLAMPPDGSKFLVVVGFVASSKILSSSDGTNWSEITSSVAPGTNIACSCAFTPDGTQAVVAYQATSLIFPVSISADGGTTWKLKTFSQVTSGVISAAYMLPPGSFR